MKADHDKLIKYFKTLFPQADSVRISAPCDRMYLILGYKRSTKDDPGQWVDQDGNPRDWEYIDESTVAIGETGEELIQSAHNYERISKMSWSDYFREIVGADEKVVSMLKSLSL